MADSFVQRIASTFHSGSVTSLAVAVNSAPGAGNTVLAAVRTGSTVTLSSVTDSKGNTWTVDAQSPGASGRVAIARTPQDAGTLTTSDTITVHLSATSAVTFAAYEYAGLLTVSPVDYANANRSGSGTSATTGTITTSNADDMLVTAVGSNATQSSITVDGAWTVRESTQSGATNSSLQWADQPVEATGTYGATWTLATTANWACVGVAYSAGSSTLSYSLATSESAAASDAATKLLSLPRALTAAAVASDAVARVDSAHRPITATANAGDAVARTLALLGRALDVPTTVDTPSARYHLGRFATDTPTATDTARGPVTRHSSGSDSAALTDSSSPLHSFVRFAVTSFLEPGTGIFPGEGLWVGWEGDIALTSDAANNHVVSGRSAAVDTAATADTARPTGRSIHASDSVTASMGAASLVHLPRLVSAAAAASDSTIQLHALTRIATEIAQLGDFDADVVSSGGVRIVSDIVLSGDAAGYQEQISTSGQESAGVAMGVSRLLATIVAGVDAAETTDTLGHAASLAAGGSDSADTLALLAQPIFTAFRSFVETANTNDSSTPLSALARQVAEAALTSDATLGFKFYVLSITDLSESDDPASVVVVTIPERQLYAVALQAETYATAASSDRLFYTVP